MSATASHLRRFRGRRPCRPFLLVVMVASVIGVCALFVTQDGKLGGSMVVDVEDKRPVQDGNKRLQADDKSATATQKSRLMLDKMMQNQGGEYFQKEVGQSSKLEGLSKAFKQHFANNSMGNINDSLIKRNATNKYINVFQSAGIANDAECVTMHIYLPKVRDTKICIHNISDDRFVSGTLKNVGTWEQDNLDALGNVLYSTPEMVFIDVGSHVGTYSVYANAIGNLVIAIDPLKSNLELLSRSLFLLNKVTKAVLLQNAVSGSHRNVSLVTGQRENIGSTYVVRDGTPSTGVNGVTYYAQTITLDDLVDEFKLQNRPVSMKLDIEGLEYEALLGARKFFTHVRVCYISMEIVVHKSRPTGRKIVEFMREFDLHPYLDPYLKKPSDNIRDFSIDVFFARNTSDCLLPKMIHY